MTRFHFERPDGPPSSNVQNISRHLNPFIPPQGFPGIAPIFFSTSDDATFVTGITFSTDGNTMFVIDSTSRKVLQYNVPEAFDISSIVDSPVSFTIDVLDADFPTDITFATGFNEGKIMYISTSGPTPGILQYQLSSAFDVQTVTNPNTPFLFVIAATIPTGVVFDLNGSKMFVADVNDGKLLEFVVVTPFQIVTIVAPPFEKVLPNGRIAGDVTFNPNDGTQMFITDPESGDAVIVQYSLSNAFDLSSTVTEIKELDISSLDTQPFGIIFSTTGFLLFFVGNVSDGVFQILLNESFELP